MTTVSRPGGSRPTVRQAERADLLAVYRIEKASFPQPWPFNAFEQYLDEPGFLVATESSVVGYVVADTVATHGRDLGHIKDLAVHEDRRGEGIGTLLLTRALGVLETQGVPAVKLEVRETNETARSLYRTQGFEHSRTIPGYYSNGEDALVMLRAF